MERNELTPQQSLAVIEQMIQATSRRVSTYGAEQFLIWGYTTVVTSLLVYFLRSYMGWNVWYLWLLIPIVGGLLTWIEGRRHARELATRSHLDRVMNVVWSLIGINTLLSAMILGSFSLPAVAIFITLGTAITGFVLRIRVIQICSVIGIVLSYGMILLSLAPVFKITMQTYSLFFALIFFIINCIPGHYLYAMSRRAGKQQAEHRGV